MRLSGALSDLVMCTKAAVQKGLCAVSIAVHIVHLQFMPDICNSSVVVGCLCGRRRRAKN